MHADTVIVGAGSAGAVIAARMTERSDRQVLLVEAGPDYRPGAEPEDLRNGRKNSMRAHDWGYRHRPTPSQVLFEFPRGRVVGGSSSVNTCIAIRGQRYDYDEWESMGLSGWGFDECLPAFKRLETDLDFDNQWHGNDGPIPLRRHPPRELVPWQAAFLEACGTLGFRPCPDHNDPTAPAGYGPHAMNKLNGERMSAARCYLTDEVRARDNLAILADTHVRRVIFRGRRACGVEVERRGVVETIHADRLVLCAGAVATPGILLRSGIGPRDELARLGVDAVAEVGDVGARLLDHPGAAIIMLPRRYLDNLRHPLIQTALRFTSRTAEYPADMQIQPGSLLPFPDADLPMVSIMAQVGKPRGSGTIRWPSADPHAKPTMDSQILVDRDDHAKAVEAMELAWLLASSEPMRDFVYFYWPREPVLMDREALGEWIYRSCGSGYHPCGTVPMGANGCGAVDDRGRVRGVEGLLVADASIMPTIPSANTNLPTLMIGERFGEWLRDGAIE